MMRKNEAQAYEKIVSYKTIGCAHAFMFDIFGDSEFFFCWLIKWRARFIVWVNHRMCIYVANDIQSTQQQFEKKKIKNKSRGTENDIEHIE